MSKPSYCIRLSGEDLLSSPISCTGKQLLLILNLLCDKEKSLVWYAADVSIFPIKKEYLNYKSYTPIIIKFPSDVIDLCNRAEQFESGIFFGVKEAKKNVLWLNEYETEGIPFSDNEFAYVEIRAFDTSYFEIFSNEVKVLKPFVDIYNCEIINRDEATR